MYSALRKAIELGNLEAVQTAINQGCDIEESDIHGYPGLPLRIACFAGHADIVRELIRRGANIDAPNDQGAGGALRAAQRGGHLAIVQMLLAHGATRPPGIHLTRPDSAERRLHGDRRKRDDGPPDPLRERRQHQERRATSVCEIELSELQWENYFSQSQPMPGLLPRHEGEHEVSLILARARD